MNKFLRVLFILVIVAMLGASILQIFLPSYQWESILVTVFLQDGKEKLEFGI